MSYILTFVKLNFPMNNLFLFLLMACFMQVSLLFADQESPDVIRVRDYWNMLQSAAVDDPLQLYSNEMAANPEECGIQRVETMEGYLYTMIPGKEEKPIRGLSQLQQEYYHQWAKQGLLQDIEKCTSPLMMIGGGGKELAKEKEANKQQQDRRYRRTDPTRNQTTFSSPQARSQDSLATEETMTPSKEINMESHSDDISAITNQEMTQESCQHSAAFLLRNEGNERLLQAQQELRLAKEEAKNVAKHVDDALRQWNISKILEIEKQKHSLLQQKLALVFSEWQTAFHSFQEAEKSFQAALQNQDPASTTLRSTAASHWIKIGRTFQEHQTLQLQVDQAAWHYATAQQTALQHGVSEGVNYGLLLHEAQLRVTQATEKVKQRNEEVYKAKFGTRSFFKNSPNSSPQQVIDSIQQEQARLSDVGLIRHEEAISPEKEEHSLSEKNSYQNQKTTEHDFSKHLMEETLSKELLPSIAHEGLIEERELAKEKHKEIVLETTKTLHDIINHLVATEQQEQAAIRNSVGSLLNEMGTIVSRKEAFSQILGFNIPATESERLENLRESAKSIQRAREREHEEMASLRVALDKFLKKSEKESKKEAAAQQEPPTWGNRIAPFIEKTGDIFEQSYRRSYEWGRDTLQFIQDQIQAQREAPKKAKEYFVDQNRRFEDVPVSEYDLKIAEVTNEPYAELVVQRDKDKAVQEIESKEKPLYKELGYFKQYGLFFSRGVRSRLLENLMSLNFEGADPNRESDERAMDYFKEIGNYNPRKLEFWEKSAQIEEQLEKEREKKLFKLLEQYPDKEERLRIASAWGNAWRDRLQQERDQKEQARLEQQKRLAEEEAEYLRKKAEDELLEEEAHKLKSKKGTKPKISKKKK